MYKGEGCGRDSTEQEQQNKPAYVRLNIAKAGGEGERSKGSFFPPFPLQAAPSRTGMKDLEFYWQLFFFFLAHSEI